MSSSATNQQDQSISMALLRKQRSLVSVDSNPQGSLENRVAAGGRLSVRSTFRKQASVDRVSLHGGRIALHRQQSLDSVQLSAKRDAGISADRDTDLRIFAAISNRRPSASVGNECVNREQVRIDFVTTISN